MMKLTLSVSGGFTGLTRQHSIDVDSLDAHTREALIHYINSRTHTASKGSLSEAWSLNGKEVPVAPHELPADLKMLYNNMKKKLQYHKK